jgi:dephospho-CoA kinase
MKDKASKRILVGLTGGPGVGKSEAAKVLAAYGACVISADKIGHSILDTNAKVRAKIKKMFGQSAFDSNGRPNREFIGRRVFADSELLAEFNSVVHPELLRLLKKELNKVAESGKKIIVVDAALIFEWCIADWFDIILVIDAAREIRIKRLMKNGLTRSQAVARIGCQMPQKDKKGLADYLITNNGGINNLKTKIAGFVKLLKKNIVN